ncbi:bifunctional 3-deoxy-7-phosphoheptulonate synthase/chorismate mutase type II [Eisenibacter elegans]|jgi:chorismate mutase|uniref:bifunctional 3-deoxy-7-phosphoheptulonate synthase/chorismate mutase type II n=1 Tax=Eisenibacter elegans TaxID=997 RepID=UPI00041DD613|nr:bifunctional 3-deoxy-7-phosphoheptulonate synthase/chorismate mutase type II [Eisenibacter elegans]
MNLDLTISPLRQWVDFKQSPLVIAGPCSAESEEQLMQTCQALQHLKVDVLRAGIWKPRTRPNSFEGFGEKALPWLQTVRKELKMPVAVEVATPQHIELALKYDVDILWLGARTTVNPFNVQEVADALRGVDVPVMIKNPVNPDLALWIGAIERIAQAGITKIAAIHRGFSSFQKTKYRNVPMWQIPIELKTYLPEIPLICDPSHIGGARDLIGPLSQKALDLNYDGLMIETHINPDQAMSDAQQQVTPTRLEEILSELKIRLVKSDNAIFINQLEELRAQIDNLDQELVELLGARLALVEKAGEYKKENNVTIFQMERWDEIFRSRQQWAEKMNLNKDFIAEIYKLIHVESIRKQTEVMSRTEAKA